ncbi:ERF family protein [Melissococcus plutonius]|uniref:ERF family protein n=1 Tax=Melissococcus plutonius TaxID=33970 RepID=UPI003F5CE771
MSEELSFIEKVLKVQSELKAPKGQRNSFGKYNYRSAEDILTAVKPLNSEQGLLLTLTDKPILIGERYYVEATATLTDGKEQIKVTAPAREAQLKKGMDDSQITGAASSYARKYALNGLYLIDDTKDADTDEFNNQQKNARTINKTQQEALAKNFEKDCPTKASINKKCGS